MGLLHAGIMNGLHDVELCAICDKSKFLLGFAKSLRDIPAYEDYCLMLDREEPDAVVLTTPVFLHIPMAKECVDRNIPFFLEKPLCLRSEEAAPLVAEIDSKGTVSMVGYMMRYMETFSLAKKIVDSQVLGKIISFGATMYVSQLFRKGKGWRYEREKSGGGVIIGQATHLIDMLQWYFGSIQKVSAHTIRFYSSEVEDFAHVYFSFEAGMSGWIDSSWSMRHHRLLETEISINTENGNLTVNDDSLKLFLEKDSRDYPAGWTTFKRPDLYRGVEIDLGGPHFSRQDMDFVSAVRENRQLQSSLKNAYCVQKVVDCIYRSAQAEGAPQEVV